MKGLINCWLLGVILLCTSGWDGLAQGTFQNLDFEMAALPVLAEGLSRADSFQCLLHRRFPDGRHSLEGSQCDGVRTQLWGNNHSG